MYGGKYLKRDENVDSVAVWCATVLGLGGMVVFVWW